MAFVRKSETSIVTLTLVVLLGITWWIAIAYFKALANTTLIENESLFRPTGASALIGNVDTSSWNSYGDSTAGFGLRYPYDWYTNEASASPFEMDFTSATGFGITASHVFPDYDDQSIDSQWQNILSAIQPLAGNYHELSSKNGVRYMRSFTETANGGGNLIAYVPTGKYTMEIQAVNAGNANDVQTFDAILQTLSLK